MRWPDRPVEQVPPSHFRPPFCPWPECPGHRGPRPPFHRHGHYLRPSDGRPIPRYRCLRCRRTCSRQTFSFSYYLKRRDLPCEVAAALLAGSAHRPIARSRGCSKSTITHLSARLGRHALLLQATALEQLVPWREPVVLDHFETFEFCQEFQVGLATPVGAHSWFLLGPDPARHRMGGKLTPQRKSRAARLLFPATKGGHTASFRRTLGLLAHLNPLEIDRIVVTTDDHAAYRAALASHPQIRRFDHRVFPNPPARRRGAPRSRQAVLRDAALFPCDALHQLLRHSLAHHRRETIAFGRRLAGILERAFLSTVWRNFIKRRSERRSESPTPAVHVGIADGPWSWGRVLAQRLFPGRVSLPEGWKKVYVRGWITPQVGRNRAHSLKHAF